MREREREWLLREKYSGKESPEYFRDLERLEGGEPLAYIIGWVDYLGCRICLSSRPLIPRPETEWWTERLIERLGEYGSTVRILDLFAGSGCIGIALLHHLSNVSVDFGEIDPAHCQEIGRNIARNRIEPRRAAVIETDGFSDIHNSYDIIVANPPYIPADSHDTVEPSVLAHEPHRALFAEDGGMRHIETLLKDAHRFLSGKSELVLEFGMGQEDAIVRTAGEFGWNVEIHNDQYNIPRWGIFTRPQ